MADVQTTDAAVSNVQLDADSLEFAVNTNLPLTAAKASPEGAAPSLQELIEAELNVRLCQPDSLEPSASLAPSSLLSCDSIEPALPAPVPAPATTPTTATAPPLSLDSLVDLDPLKDTLGQGDTESGIDLLSPTKLDDLSNLDSLESSSDLPASPSRSSPEPSALSPAEDQLLPQQGSHSVIMDDDETLLPLRGDRSSFKRVEGQHFNFQEQEGDDISLEGLQAAPPLLRISESDLLTVDTESLSLSESRSEISREVSRASSPDSLSSDSASPQESSDPQLSADPHECTSSQDSASPQPSAFLLDSVASQGTPPPQDSAILPTSPAVSGIALQQDIITSEVTLSVQDSVDPQDAVALQDAVITQDTAVSQDTASPQDTAALEDTADRQDTASPQDTAAPEDTAARQDTVISQITDAQQVTVVEDSAELQDGADLPDTIEAAGGRDRDAALTTPESPTPSQATAEVTALLSTDQTSSTTSLSSSQGLSSSPLRPSSPVAPPSPTGASPQDVTNSVCGGVSSNAAADHCGATGVGSDVEPTSATACSSGGGGGSSGPDTPLQNGSNMEPQRDDDDDDFWGSKNDDDDYVPRHRFRDEDDQAEDDPGLQYQAQDDVEAHDEGNGNYIGLDDDDVIPSVQDDDVIPTELSDDVIPAELSDDVIPTAGVALLKKKKKSKVENGVGAESEEKKKKKAGDGEKAKKRSETEDGEKIKKKSETEDGEKVKKKRETEDGEKIKKKRVTEDGEKIKKKKKKRRGDSEKENKEASSSGSSSELESEEEAPPAPTPPLYNGHALLQDVSPGPHDAAQMKDETLSDGESVNGHEAYSKEGFHNLVDAYNRESSPSKEPRAHTPLSDEEDLAGVNVKQLRGAYLSAARDTKQAALTNHKADIKPEIKADLKASVNISSLVDTYSSPQHRAATPSTRPDDITPISLQSLKSVYEATATGASSAGSRHSSSGSSSPAGGSPAPKEELNISLHQLREEYCRSVQDGHSRSHTPTRTPLDTGVSIRQLDPEDPFPLYSLLDKHDTVSQVSSECRQCGKQVFQMEKIVAEKAAWHKNCFRCKECNCVLTLETYQSHEGVLYCKPHFKELFRPKVVVEDPDEARKERSTNKPDYGLEDLSTANLKQKFAMFEQISTEEERTPETIPVRRSQSLLSKAARFMQSEDDDYGIENSELGEYEEYDEDEDEEEDEEEGEEGEEDETKKKKGRPTSFSGMKDLKAGFARKNRQDQLSRKRREELAKFRQMLCAGKNISTREMFEAGNLEDDQDRPQRKGQIKIEGRPDAKNLRERFEKGLSIAEDGEGENEEHKEVDHVFKDAETANKARNLFKQIDMAVSEGGEPVMRPHSSAVARRENRLSRDGVDVEWNELGRDPNLVKCTDNYEDAVDCRGTRNLLAKFRKMEMQADDEDRGLRPLKRFTPPPEGEEEYDSDEEYSDEEYSDEDEEDSEEEEEDDEEEENERKPKYKDEILEMVKSSQSAKKAASLRAKFEKWESEVERNNELNQNNERNEDEEECMPSIDTARNLRAMFENKVQEATRPANDRPKVKVNRFVGGGGDKCMLCDRTVYAMERLEVAGRVLHKNCFKCCKCSTKLSMNTFSIGGEDMYCTTHYKQAFTEKGTYDVFTPNKG